MHRRRRARRTEDDLEHPDEEAVAADHTDSDEGPDSECEDQEGKHLYPSARTSIAILSNVIDKLRHCGLPNATEDNIGVLPWVA